jgi:glycosyltransferase involved in cell wall biosynthesis
VTAGANGTKSAAGGTGGPRTVVYLDHTAKWSGGEIALLRMLEALDRDRVTPVVVLASDGPFAERLREVKVETVILPLAENLREVRKDSLGGAGLLGKVGAAASFAGYANTVSKYARQRGASLLHCNSLKADIYGAMAGKVARIPVLWHVRDHIDPTYLPGAAVKGFRAMARRLPDFVVTNSDSTAEKLFPEGYSPDRCRAVYDGLADRELHTPAPPVIDRWKNDPPRVGIIGRIVEWKGQHIFLEAAEKVIAAGGEAKFVIIGAPLFGEEAFEKKLQAQAEKLGGRVEFTGFRTDIPDLLRGLDILVHASITPEPFGQVVIEGMAEGIPVIGSDGGGVREIMTHGENGLLTPMGDAEALARELGALLKDPARANRLARAGHVHVRQNFTAAHTARKMEQVYDVIGSSRRMGRRKAAQAVTTGGA